MLKRALFIYVSTSLLNAIVSLRGCRRICAAVFLMRVPAANGIT